MIINYKQTKEDVLKMYQELLVIVDEVKDELRFLEDNKSMIALKNQAENIKKDKFLLMVAGESKSGKSTFINAYLGQEILPMDVKQCTSAIVEIKYGDNFTLTATYADGRTTRLDDEEDIKKFLVENAALNDDYRDIPVTTINNEILIKYKGNIRDWVINDLINGVQSENIHALSPEDYAEKIRAYIENNKNNWVNIVTKMIVTYKFEDESLRGVEIIDSPGVNARGRIGDITDDYIENANAIMFLKPIIGAALESTSFRSFLDTKSVERNEGTLFLILTRAANENLENLERLQQEALKLYGSKIQKNHIFVVDSKVELFINRVSHMTVDRIKDYLDELESRGLLDTFITPPRSMEIINKDAYIKFLKEKSNFAKVDDALNIFGRKTHYLALSEFLGRMHKVYRWIHDDLKERIELNELKVNDPGELASPIKTIKKNIEEIESKMHKTVNEIITLYTGDSGVIRTKIKSAMDDFITSVNAIPNDDINELEKISFRLINKMQQFQLELQKNIVAECNTALISLSDENKIRYTSLEPDFTVKTFREIVLRLKPFSEEIKSYTEGTTFKTTRCRSEYSRHRHFRLIKSNIQKRLKVIQDKVIDMLYEFTYETANTYNNELKSNAKARKAELDRIEKEKKEAEEILKSIESMQKTVNLISPLVKSVRERKIGIDKHV